MKKVILFLCLLLILVSSCAPTPFQGKRQMITVSGSGSASAIPDKASVIFGIREEGDTSKAAAEKHTESAAKVMATLIQKGIKNKDIKTVRFYISPIYNYPKKGSPIIIGYKAESGLKANISDISITEEIINACLAAGAIKVRSLNYELKDQKKLYGKAIAKAKEDAQTKADALAKEFGFKGVKPVLIKELGTAGSPVRMFSKASKSSNSKPSLAPGEITVQSNIEVEYKAK